MDRLMVPIMEREEYDRAAREKKIRARALEYWKNILNDRDLMKEKERVTRAQSQAIKKWQERKR